MWLLFYLCLQFDIDKNGHITSTELGEVFKSLGESVPGYKLREMIAQIDKDKNGTVEFDEFVEVYNYSYNTPEGSKNIYI